jgi:hypothetical protein
VLIKKQFENKTRKNQSNINPEREISNPTIGTRSF